MTETRQGPPGRVRPAPPGAPAVVPPAPPPGPGDGRVVPQGAGPRLPIDPRIRRRRIEVRRDEGRRRRRVLIGCLAVVGVVAGAVGAGRSPLLDVDYVDVRGTDHTPRPAVVAAGGLADHPAMLDVDTAAVARAVERLPWVLTATARRTWPGTVRIDVVERRPAAVIPTGDGAWALADVAGRVLAHVPDKPTGLPAIGNLAPPGPPGTTVDAAAGPSLAVSAALTEELRGRIADVAAVEGGEVELQLTPPGGVVRLGPPTGLAEKLRVLATVLAKADLARVASVDVRVPRAPALTRR